MGFALLYPGWDPEHPDYEQMISYEDEEEFASAFNTITGELMMDFGGAIAAVKAGHKVYREAWSQEAPGKHVKLLGVDSTILVPGDNSDAAKYVAGPDDQLAEDWRFFNLPDTGDATAGDPLAQRTYADHASPAGPADIEGPTIPEEFVEAGNVEYVDTASVGPVPVGPKSDSDGDDGA